jgi:hypothetical protein
MDDLVRTLLADLSANLDRLADALQDEQPTLARRLRFEASVASPLEAAESRGPQPLRPLLYDSLAAGVIEHPRFDRLMLLEARARSALTADLRRTPSRSARCRR